MYTGVSFKEDGKDVHATGSYVTTCKSWKSNVGLKNLRRSKPYHNESLLLNIVSRSCHPMDCETIYAKGSQLMVNYLRLRFPPAKEATIRVSKRMQATTTG